MADIIVTVPRDQYDHFWGDKVPAIEAWWSMRRRPKRLEPGDSIGFVIDNAIRAAATVERIIEDYGMWRIYFTDAGGIKPVPYEPFRGFRYFELPELGGEKSV